MLSTILLALIVVGVIVVAVARHRALALDPDAFTPRARSAEAQRLEELRAAIRAESISYGELAELESLAEHIEPGDVELLEWAGVPERVVNMDTAELDPGDPDEAAELTRRARAAEAVR